MRTALILLIVATLLAGWYTCAFTDDKGADIMLIGMCLVAIVSAFYFTKPKSKP